MQWPGHIRAPRAACIAWAVASWLTAAPSCSSPPGDDAPSADAGPSDDAPRYSPRFLDVTDSAGIDFVGTYGPTFDELPAGALMAQRNTGNGAAVGDYDRDGDLDIYLLGQLGHSNRLFRNDLDLGVKSFTDVTATAGVDNLGLSRVAHFVDLDNDGNLDLLVINDMDEAGLHPASAILRNDGDGSFTDVTTGSGFEPTGYLRTGAALADFDRDGLLDVYVTVWRPDIGAGPWFTGTNRLYRNLGNFSFADVTEAVGLPALDVASFTSIFTDFDGDRFADLYVAVDFTADSFFKNSAGVFSDTTATVGIDHDGNDMGVACADFDDDDDLDMYVTNITDPGDYWGDSLYNVLYVNEQDTLGATRFTDQAVARGVEDTFWGWGAEFTDVDNDGDLDLVAVNGWDEEIAEVGVNLSLYQTPAILFINDGSGQFDRLTGAGLDDPQDSRALIAFDYDRDGDEDLLVTNVDQPARLFENVSNPKGHWLEVALVQRPGQNPDGIGATIYAEIGSVTKRRDIICGDSYLAGTPQEVHFGLGASTVVDTLRVRWTDGSETTLEDVPADQLLRIVQ